MYKRLVVALSAIAVVSACGDDPVALVDTTDLSIEEIEALFAELGTALSGIGAPSAAPPPSLDGPLATPVQFDIAIDETIPCETGATTLVGTSGGVADSETGALDLTIDFTWGFNDCVIQSTETETVFTLNSAPGIDYVADIVLDPAAFTITAEGTQTGGIRIQTADGRDGTCVFDASYSASTNTSTGASTLAVSGTVCGVDVSLIGSYSIVTGA